MIIAGKQEYLQPINNGLRGHVRTRKKTVTKKRSLLLMLLIEAGTPYSAAEVDPWNPTSMRAACVLNNPLLPKTCLLVVEVLKSVY